ncbi:MAG TPA: enoyl-[acyl-carrier-protein] reductase FabI, partial [Legionella sp.]|nr:enoyl-[acyl-carrier-protein] reductase FabI [Legionella sp.]
AHDISAYSLVALSKAAFPMMEGTQGAILTLSYYGAEKAVPNYNVMGIAKASLEASVRYLAASLGPRGIRVNAVSAGPIRTLAAAGIKDFRKMQAAYAESTPLRRNITPEEVGNTAAFLCSDLGSGITGEVVHVDAGYHAVSMSDLG